MTEFAFFDVDETLITVKSMFDILPFVADVTGLLSPQDLLEEIQIMRIAGVSREQVNYHYYTAFENLEVRHIIAASESWFDNLLRSHKRPFNTAIVAQLCIERNNGRQPVLVSGSAELFLRPLARHLDVQYVMATQMQQHDGILTGQIAASMIGEGKRHAVAQFLRTHEIDGSDCSAYGDHISDLPMLESVGFPNVVQHAPDLELIAKKRGWPILTPHVPLHAQHHNEVLNLK